METLCYDVMSYFNLATPSSEESKALEDGDNYSAIGPSEQSQQQTPLNPETIERNKNYLKAMDNFQVSWAHFCVHIVEIYAV